VFEHIINNLDKQRSNLLSNEPKPPNSSNTAKEKTASERCPPLTEPPAERSHYIYAAYQPVTVQVNTDQTGRFLLPSSSGNKGMLILYDFDSNPILVEPRKSERTRHAVLLETTTS